MSENRRFYWLKLKEDFFEDDTIQWIEEQENGKEYALFYLKLCLKSLNMDGKVVRVIGERLMPYDKRSLAKVTNTDVDTVVIALELFKSIGLVDVYESGEIYMKQIEEMTGSETEAAQRKRRYRARLEQNDTKTISTGHCPDDVLPSSRNGHTEYRDKSLDLEKEQQQQRENENPKDAAVVDKSPGMVFRFYEKNMGDLVEPVIQRLNAMIDESSEPLVQEALKRAIEANARHKLNFADQILKSWQEQRIRTLTEVWADDEAFMRRKQQNSKGANRYGSHKQAAARKSNDVSGIDF